MRSEPFRRFATVPKNHQHCERFTARLRSEKSVVLDEDSKQSVSALWNSKDAISACDNGGGVMNAAHPTNIVTRKKLSSD